MICLHHSHRPSCTIHRAAFTLVDLMVVVAIIALLISMMLPVLQKAREAAELVHCQSNLRQQGVAMLTYAATYNGQLPAFNIYKNPPDHDDYGPDRRRSTWMQRLAEYVGGPVGTPMHTKAGHANSVDALMEVFQCPTTWGLSKPNDNGHSYGINTFIVSPHLWSNHAYGPTSLSLFDQRGGAERMLMIGDNYGYTPERGSSWKAPLLNGRNHNSGLNFVFVDGHASYSGPIEPVLMVPESTTNRGNVDLVVGGGSSPWATKYVSMSW